MQPHVAFAFITWPPMRSTLLREQRCWWHTQPDRCVRLAIPDARIHDVTNWPKHSRCSTLCPKRRVVVYTRHSIELDCDVVLALVDWAPKGNNPTSDTILHVNHVAFHDFTSVGQCRARSFEFHAPDDIYLGPRFVSCNLEKPWRRIRPPGFMRGSLLVKITIIVWCLEWASQGTYPETGRSHP